MAASLTKNAQDVLDVIKGRATTKVFTDEPVPHEVVEQLIEAAIAAPNHHLNQPWRFQVYSGAARHRLVETLVNAVTGSADVADPRVQTAIEKIQRTNVRAPVVIVVIQVGTDHPKARTFEDTCAVAAAAQNLLVAATAYGLGTFWRTGAAVDFPAVWPALGLQPDDRIIGFLDVGYPRERRKASQRLSVDAVTTWLES